MEEQHKQQLRVRVFVASYIENSEISGFSPHFSPHFDHF
jgi:hypothetical protein